MDQASGVWRLGAIVWREAATTDIGRTTAFYGQLLGWTHHDSPMGEMGVYRHFEVGGQSVAGCYQLGPQMAGVPAHWMHYVSVADVDAAAEKAKALGATVNMGPFDIPNVGRAAYITDPQGANVALFRDFKGDTPAMAPPFPVGAFCWETLSSTDPAGSVAFYTAVAGHKAGTFGESATLGTDEGPQSAIADVSPVPPGVPSNWMSHVVVENLAESRERAVALGATVMMAEIVMPSVGKMAIILDPVGAAISLFEPEPR